MVGVSMGRTVVKKDRRPYITTTWGMSGYFAVLMSWYDDMNGYDVSQTGVGRYRTLREAQNEANSWGMNEGIRVLL